MLILGCDPGLTGAITLLRAAGDRVLLECADIPVCENGISTGSMKRWVNVEGLNALLDVWAHRHDFAREHVTAVIERPIPMPSLPAQTIASQFDTFGVLRAVLGMAADEIAVVNPKEWKAIYGFGNDKAEARRCAQSLYPHAEHYFRRVADHNRAESCLVGHFWARTQA